MFSANNLSLKIDGYNHLPIEYLYRWNIWNKHGREILHDTKYGVIAGKLANKIFTSKFIVDESNKKKLERIWANEVDRLDCSLGNYNKDNKIQIAQTFA